MQITHFEKSGPRNDPRNFDLSKWDRIGQTWWYRKYGDIEIYLSSDAGLNWEISQMKHGENMVKPVYISNFDDAYAEATRLCEFHEKAQLTFPG